MWGCIDNGVMYDIDTLEHPYYNFDTPYVVRQKPRVRQIMGIFNLRGGEIVWRYAPSYLRTERFVSSWAFLLGRFLKGDSYGKYTSWLSSKAKGRRDPA